MTSPLIIAAGPTAYEHIKKNGLSPDDISAVFGASGAAKWLAIAGLDARIFGDWLTERQNPTPIDLFGTSVGAFKLAAAARTDPRKALEKMAHAYVHQSYANALTYDAITDQTNKTMSKFLGADDGSDDISVGIGEVLGNPHYRLHIGAVRCHGRLNEEGQNPQRLAMLRAGLLSPFTDRHLRGLAERVVFSDPRHELTFHARDGFAVSTKTLTADNFENALQASGAIPVYMRPVRLSEDPDHIYRDGGLLDYHPLPGSFWPERDGLILYPHFYGHFKKRWFDKFYPWRKARAAELDRVVMLAPNRAFIKSLPDGKIPSRQGFVAYRKNEAERFDKWSQVVERSAQLGAVFIDACASGKISQLVRPLPL
jgi:predicted acylesterase/phospholipase RssA